MDDTSNSCSKTRRQLRKKTMLRRLQEIKLRMCSSQSTSERSLRRQSCQHDHSLILVRTNSIQQLLRDLPGHSLQRSSNDRLNATGTLSASRTTRIVIVFLDRSQRRRTRLLNLYSGRKPKTGIEGKSSRLVHNNAQNSRFDLQSLMARGRITLRVIVTVLRTTRRHRANKKAITDSAKDNNRSADKK